jgi:chromosome segregation ATPase
MIQFLATVTEYEDLGIKTLLITTVLVLVAVIRHLYKEHQKDLKEKDEAHQKEIREKDARIMEVIKEHQNDLKENTNDMKSFLEKYHQFTNQIKDLVHGK